MNFQIKSLVFRRASDSYRNRLNLLPFDDKIEIEAEKVIPDILSESIIRGEIIVFLDYIIQNWALILIGIAFAISLKITGFQDKGSVKRMYILIAGVFLLSIVVFEEFYLADIGGYQMARTVLMAVRYSATPVIVAMVLYTLQKKTRWFIFIPALVLAVINVISIFTGIVFSLAEDGTLQRGLLGYLPYIVAGLYGVFLIYVLYKRSNKLYTEIIPIAFLALAFASGVFLPFIFGTKFAQIFCTTIMIALFVYYVFSIHQLSKIDPLTGVLNLQAFYADSAVNQEDITALISMDMNGLKKINDTLGHAAGDQALVTVAECFMGELNSHQAIYRIGGDEFVIICRKTPQNEVEDLIRQIQEKLSKTKYSGSIGYSYSVDGKKPVNEMLRESDENMYAAKAKYYSDSRTDRRRR